MNLTEKWKELLEADGAPVIEGVRKQKLMATIFENQDKDINTDVVYRDPQMIEAFNAGMNEAQVGGDGGYSTDAQGIAAGQTSGSVTNIGPTVMGMVRRAIPKLIAFDVCGVQTMKGPTSQVFTLRTIYGANPLDANAQEAFHPTQAPDASFSGQSAGQNGGVAIAALPAATALVLNVPYKATLIESDTKQEVRYFLSVTGAVSTNANAGELTSAEYLSMLQSGSLAEVDAGMATSLAELQENFNGTSSNAWNEMSFRIDKQIVEAKGRQLKAQYSIELAQDLRAVHGMDADSELSNILANEVMLEINREIVNLINGQAQLGKSGWTKGAGDNFVFSMTNTSDVRGARWAGEAYKALLIQIDKEANEIGRQTGRGCGNFIIASRNVVSALSATETMVTPAAQGMATGLNTDTNMAVYAGMLGDKYKVYIDQYAVSDYFTVGFKGSSEMDAGIFYCPYVPLTPLRGSDSRNFQPVIGLKTRYGIQVNPFSDPTSTNAGRQKIASGMADSSTMGKNAYFRRVFVTGL